MFGPNAFAGLDKVITWMFWLSVLGIILGVWKLIEIVIWLNAHLHLRWTP